MLKTLIALATALSIATPALAACDAATFENTSIPSVPVSFPTWTIAAADLNEDGWADVVGANGTNGVAVALGRTYDLAPPVTLPTGSSSNVLDIAIADVNGNGNLDIITANGDDGTISIILGDGELNTFHAPVVVATGGQTRAIHAADIDRDGKLDLVFFSGQTLQVYRGAGNGTFTPLSSLALAIPTTLAIADFDGDQKLDVAAGNYAPSTITLLLGNGDGTFRAQPALSTAAFPAAFAAAELNGDGHPDLVVANEDAHLVSVLLNDGSGGFAAPATYTLSGNPSDLAVGNFTNHGVNDVAVANGNHGEVVVFRTAAEGTLFAPSARSVGGPWRIAAADLDRDGRLDIAATINTNRLGAIYNACGKVSFALASDRSVTNVNQTVPLSASMVRTGTSSLPLPPFTGTITLREGAAVIQTLPVNPDGRQVDFAVGPLTAGLHVFTADYSGDGNSDPATSSFHLTATTESTTTTATLTPMVADYGDPILASVQVTSSTGDSPSGLIFFDHDNLGGSFPAPQGSVTFAAPPAGSHDVVFRYSGDQTHPPSRQTVVLTTRKAKGKPELHVQTGTFVAGEPFSANVNVPLGTGTVTLQDGQTPIATLPLSGGSAQFQPALGVGVHTLRATYNGDQNVEAATSAPVQVTVISAQPLSLLVQGSPDRVDLLWAPYPGAANYRVLVGSTEQITSPYTFYSHPYGTPRQPYLYRVQALDANDNVLATAADIGTRMGFTDELLDGALIKAVHLLELRDQINELRSRVSLAPITLSIAAGGIVRAADVQTLRNALNETRTAWGVPQVTFSETLSGAVVRAAQLTELREAMR